MFLVLERLMQLVINTPGTFITQKDECFRLKQKEKLFDISPLKVESIVISNQAMISSQAWELVSWFHIPDVPCVFED